MKRCYSDLIQLPTFDERLSYLRIASTVGSPTFGHERWMNQRFYTSAEWRSIRDYVITRDGGFDLGSQERPIPGKIIVHHMCPLTVDTLSQSDITILDPEYLISCSMDTHNAIHFGGVRPVTSPVERKPYDTCPWRK